jgi:hypothetical protein
VTARMPTGGHILALLSIAVITVAQPVRAQSDAGAEAEAMFREGKRLLEQQDFTHACPKLAESYRLDPATGALLALAVCHEGQGKTATAWAEYSDVASRAKAEGRSDREAAAREKIAALGSKLSTLTISVPPDVGSIEGFRVQRDGADVGPAVWGVAIPVDPGTHVVEATGMAKSAWRTTVVVGALADKKSIEVPRLVEMVQEGKAGFGVEAQRAGPQMAPAVPNVILQGSPASRPEPTPPPPPPRGRYFKTYSIVLGAAGGAALAAGGIVWLISNNRFDNLQTECNNGCTIEDRQAKINDIVTLDKWAAGLAISGGILAGTAAVLQWALPHSEEDHAYLTVDPMSRALLFGGQF